MRHEFPMAGAILLLLVLFYSGANPGGILALPPNATIQSLNISAAINYTNNTINAINESNYLIFYPNLAQSYFYLSWAENVSKNDTPMAYTLLDNALYTAKQQQQSIYKYAFISFVVLLVLAIVVALLIYRIMYAPLVVAKKKNKR